MTEYTLAGLVTNIVVGSYGENKLLLKVHVSNEDGVYIVAFFAKKAEELRSSLKINDNVLIRGVLRSFHKKNGETSDLVSLSGYVCKIFNSSVITDDVTF